VGERGSGLRRSFGCSPARRNRVQLSLFHLHDRAAPCSGLARLAAFGWIAFRGRPRPPGPGVDAATPAVSIGSVSMSRTRVALADDDVLLREGLASLLERSGFEVVGQCGEASELIALVRAQRPDLALVDIRMPPTHSTEGLDAARLIRQEFPQTAILVLSAHVEVEHAMDLLASGERTGYLLKSRVTDVEEFIATLERIVKGGSIVDPALVQELVAARRVQDPLEDLTPREREVLSLMAEGRSNAGIARQLWVTEGTVEKHVHHILGSLRLPETGDDHRRVLAVLTFLDAR
jgi:DNA-binding NarL/FixJ family response regulator